MAQRNIVAQDRAFEMGDEPIVSIQMLAKVDDSVTEQLITFKIYMYPEQKCELYVAREKIGNCEMITYREDTFVLEFLVTEPAGTERLTTLSASDYTYMYVKSELHRISTVLANFMPVRKSSPPNADASSASADDDDYDSGPGFATRIRFLVQ